MSQSFKLKDPKVDVASTTEMKNWVEHTVLAALPVPDPDFVHLVSEALLYAMHKRRMHDADAAKRWVSAELDRFLLKHGMSVRAMSEHSGDASGKTVQTDDGVIVSANKYAPSVPEVDRAMLMVKADQQRFSGRVRVAT